MNTDSPKHTNEQDIIINNIRSMLEDFWIYRPKVETIEEARARLIHHNED